MSKELARFIAIAGCLVAAQLVRAEAPAAAPGTGQASIDYVALYDPEGDASVRSSQQQLLLRRAEGGDHVSQCLLGRLHHAQAVRPSGVNGGEADLAAKWLNACILGGDMNAMLVMAELDLAQGRVLEAAVWTQGFLKLVTIFGEGAANDAAAYRAALLARIDRQFGGKRPDNMVLLEYVAGFLANYGDRIIKACRAGGCHPWPALPGEQTLVMTNDGTSYTSRLHRERPSLEDNAYATYLVEVDEEGRTQRVLQVESYPDVRGVRKLYGWARTRRYAAAPDGTGSRYRFLYGSFDNGMLDLEADANARARGSRL